MSSLSVRDSIKDFLQANVPSENRIDIDGEYFEIRDLLAEYNLQPDAPWLGLQFIGDEELPVSLSATNDKGLYREYGSIVLHICEAERIGVGELILTRGEVLRNLFRGRNIEGIVIEGVTPVNFGIGATLDFEGGYVSGTVTVSYHMDIGL